MYHSLRSGTGQGKLSERMGHKAKGSKSVEHDGKDSQLPKQDSMFVLFVKPILSSSDRMGFLFVGGVD